LSEVSAEPNAAPDRGGITAFHGTLSSQPPRQVAQVARDMNAQSFLLYLNEDVNQETTLAGALAFYGPGWTFTPHEPGSKAGRGNGRPRQ
jgi:hypothetical protein